MNSETVSSVPYWSLSLRCFDVDGLETTVCVCRNEETDTLAILPLKGEAFEKESIIRALKACNGHREQAAGMLNINPATLYRKMKNYGLK